LADDLDARDSRRLSIACAALVAISLGAWIGTGIGHRRGERKSQQAEHATRARAEAAARKERRQKRQERSSEALDDTVDQANARLLRAAGARDRAAVVRAEAALAQATRRREAAQRGSTRPVKDPYVRELERFPITRPPLFAQQITSSEDDHVLFCCDLASVLLLPQCA